MAYKSEMARAREQKRQGEAAKRRALRHKMNGYNSLSNRPRSKPEDYTYNGQKTVNDILLELADTMTNKRETYKRKTFVDNIVPDVVSEATKEYWRDRIGRGGLKF